MSDGRKPIYLDGRERDLVRRALAYTKAKCQARLSHDVDIEAVALKWLVSEIDAIAVKFQEPT